MSPFGTAVVMVALMASWLLASRQWFHYSCPYCGSRSEDRHDERCPWKDPK